MIEQSEWRKQDFENQTFVLMFLSFLEINPVFIRHFNDVVTEMLDAGVQIDSRNEYGFTALGRVALNNHTDIVDVLLQTRANLDEKSDVACWTPLYCAARDNSKTSWESYCSRVSNVTWTQQKQCICWKNISKWF